MMTLGLLLFRGMVWRAAQRLLVSSGSRGVSGACVALALLGCASGPARPPRGVQIGDASYLSQALDYEVPRTMDDLDLASIAITVVDADGPIYERAFGKANVEENVAATLDTQYRWGSNAKLFVTLALLQLAEQGKLSLDAPLTRYIPEFEIGPPPTYLPESRTWTMDSITIRRMLTHHSGLPNDILGGMLSDRPGSYRDHVGLLKNMNAQAPGGLLYSYSNVAFSLLGVVIERVSGESFDSYVKSRIFRLVGMDEASFTLSDRHLARPYAENGKRLPIYRLADVPAGALDASTREMGRFASAILRGGVGKRGRFISQASLLASFQRQNAQVALDLDLEVGLGWMVNPLPVEVFGRNIGHGGSGPGYHSEFALLTDDGVAVLVVTNAHRGAGKLGAILKRALGLAREVKTGRPTAEPRLEPVHKAETADENELRRSAGHYATLIGSVDLTRDDDQLTLLLDGTRLILKPLVDGRWGVWAELWGLIDLQPGSMSRVRVSFDSIGGRKVVVVHTPRGRLFFGVAYQPTKATMPWTQRVGTYQAVGRPGDFNPIEGIELYIAANGQLMATPALSESNTPITVALRVIDSQTVISEGLGRNQGMRMTVDIGGDLHLAGLRFRRVSVN